LEKLVTALQGRKKSPVHLTRNSKLFKTILKAIKEKKGEEIVSLDLRKIDEAVADFFILCEARSHIQVKAIADFVEETIKKDCEERPYRVEHGGHWTLIDYVNVVVHVFQHEHRRFYDLESLWEDAERQEHNDKPAGKGGNNKF
jgi:ribosome-associated protein